MFQKIITKKSRNTKLKEKYYINEKTHLATEKLISVPPVY